MQLNTILIDDERNCLRVLELVLQQSCPEVNIVSICQSAKEGLYAVKNNTPDLIFLDIDMPYMNGFEFLELLPNKDNIDIVFVTAHNEYAIQAIKTSAVDYLLKPVKETELRTTIDTIIQKRQSIRTDKYTFLLSQLEAIRNNEMTKIALPTFDGLNMVHINEIIYCEADDNYAYVYMTNNRKLLIAKSLRFLQDILPAKLFYRNHKSFLINLKRIERYVKSEGGYLIMEGNNQVSISRSKKEELIQLINQHFSV